jgi:type IV pilus assembly protein PilN
MIRINLLPVKKARKREAGQRQILYMGLAVMVSVAGVIFVHLNTASERDEIRRKGQTLQSEIARYKAEMGDYDKIVAQREELLKQRRSIDALNLGRTGPTYLLRELSEILTPGKGPTFDRLKYEESLRRDPNVGFKASWDTRRVWIEAFEEQAKKLKIKGAAKSHEDVAEFLKRLQLSVFFADANLETTVSVPGPAGAVKHVTFTFSATVIY